MSHFVRSASLVNYAEIAHSVGLDPLSRLRAVGISYQALLDPDTKISATSVSRLLESSARASKTEDFGLRMAETRQLANLGPCLLYTSPSPRD